MGEKRSSAAPPAGYHGLILPAERPAGVQHVAVHNVSAQSMLLAWQPVTGATGYRLSWAALAGR